MLGSDSANESYAAFWLCVAIAVERGRFEPECRISRIIDTTDESLAQEISGYAITGGVRPESSVRKPK